MCSSWFWVPSVFCRWLLVGLHILFIEVGSSPHATDRRMAILRLAQSLWPLLFPSCLLRKLACGWEASCHQSGWVQLDWRTWEEWEGGQDSGSGKASESWHLNQIFKKEWGRRTSRQKELVEQNQWTFLVCRKWQLVCCGWLEGRRWCEVGVQPLSQHHDDGPIGSSRQSGRGQWLAPRSWAPCGARLCSIFFFHICQVIGQSRLRCPGRVGFSCLLRGWVCRLCLGF